MTIDKSIFGLRFGGNVALYPTLEELRAFLKSPKQTGRREAHSRDLAAYGKMLEEIAAFEREQQDAGPQDCRKIIFYGVLGHSGLFSGALKSEVEYFKYHVYMLSTLDFKKPTAFIKTANEELTRLASNKKESAAKLARLRSLVGEREKALEALNKRRSVLIDELTHITRYIRENLVKIEKLCETSIVVLVDPKIAQREEKRILAEIKEFIKEELRTLLHQGAIKKQHLEAAKKDIDAVSREVSALIREDIYALARLYEAVYEHVRKIVREIDVLLAKIDDITEQHGVDSDTFFTQLEQVVVSLVSDFHFELETPATYTDTAHKNVLLEKRKEMLDIIFGLLQEDRRARSDRRAKVDRRKFNDPGRKGPERRTGNERRTRKGRRNT